MHFLINREATPFKSPGDQKSEPPGLSDMSSMIQVPSPNINIIQAVERQKGPCHHGRLAKKSRTARIPER